MERHGSGERPGAASALEYLLRILKGELFKSKSHTPGYKLTLEVAEGEHEGRRCWHDAWLTPDALPMTKRDLAKIGVTDPKQLDRPLPAGILIRARIARRKNDDGVEYNHVVRFGSAGIEPGDAFAPPQNTDNQVSVDGGDNGVGDAAYNDVAPDSSCGSERQ